MRIDVRQPETVAIPGVAQGALVQISDDVAEVAIAAGQLETRRRLTNTEITMMGARWLIGAVTTTAAAVSFTCRRTDDGR